MNAEIERALVAALAVALPEIPVVPSLTSDVAEIGGGRVVVDASGENESPVTKLWKLPVIFRAEYPAMEDDAAGQGFIRTCEDRLRDWLRDRVTVHGGFESAQVQLLPGYHVSNSRHRNEGDRLVAEIEIMAGFYEI